MSYFCHTLLKHWADYQFLQKLNCREFHVYDNDVAKYQETVDAINARGDGSYATMTLKREIETFRSCLCRKNGMARSEGQQCKDKTQ